VSANWVADSLRSLPSQPIPGSAFQMDAQSIKYNFDRLPVVSTDPPYYDNISYADISDFFYVWLRRSLRDILPSHFSTLMTPKSDELVISSSPNGEESEEVRFQEGFRQVFQRIGEISNSNYPTTVFYAFKQEEEKHDERASTGWEKMLEGLISSGFQITATFPVRTTKKARSEPVAQTSAFALKQGSL